MAAYEMVIGLEVHVELATKTKIFCACTTQFGGTPNTHCCPICTGMPGTLPVLNAQVVDYAIATGLALSCDIIRDSKFDRKNYFYPDLPKAYQVSQLYTPICRNGHMDIEVDGVKKSISIHEIHMEEDAGKLVHDPWTDRTMVDYNRCGVPLLEIVSEPDIRSAQEAIAYLEKLKATLTYLGVSDCKMQEGSLRADVNLSVRPTSQKTLGTRTEMKNLNSFKGIARAIAGEFKRQVELLDEGKRVRQETRRWDDNKDTSFAMRSKEDAQDYRYFPEPDLTPLKISEQWIARIKDAQPELMEGKIARYQAEFDLPAYDAAILTADKAIADLFEQTTAICGRAKEASNWIMGEVMGQLKEKGMLPEDMTLTPAALSQIITMVADGQMNRQGARQVLATAFDADIDVAQFAIDSDLVLAGDDGAYRQILLDVLATCEADVRSYREGNTKVFGFLVGQAMKALKGKADPKRINQLLREVLGE